MEQQPREEQALDDDRWKIIKEKQLKKLKHIFYCRLAHLRVPVPPGIMVPSKSASRSQWVNPLLQYLLQEDCSIDKLQHYLDEQTFRARFMMSVIMVGIILVSVCNPSYSSAGVWFGFYCIYILCTLTYLVWLRYKKKLVKKYRVSIAKWVLELRKELPDQCDDRLINTVCNKATKSSGFQDILICYVVMNGIVGILLFRNYYLGFGDSWIHSGCILGLVLCGIYLQKPVTSNDDELKVCMEQPPDDDIVSSDDDDDDELKVSMEQPPDTYGKQREFFSRHLADLGVPMPPGMVLKKSTRFMIPLLEDLVEMVKTIVVTWQEYHNRKAFMALVMMPPIFVVIVVVSICNPSYASLGVGLWFCCIYVLCTLTYLVWLTYKEKKLLEKYRVTTAEWVLKKRKELPTVEVDNVEADQCAHDLINRLCYRATIPPLNISYSWIHYAVLVGILGIVFCGDYYWNA